MRFPGNCGRIDKTMASWGTRQIPTDKGEPHSGEQEKTRPAPPGAERTQGRGCDRRAQRGKRSPESRPPGGQFVRPAGREERRAAGPAAKGQRQGDPHQRGGPQKAGPPVRRRQPPRGGGPGGGEGIRQRGGHLRPGGRERGAPLPAGVRRAGRPPQPGGGNPHGGVRRRPRGW